MTSFLEIIQSIYRALETVLPEAFPALQVPGVEAAHVGSWALAVLLFVFLVGLFRRA